MSLKHESYEKIGESLAELTRNFRPEILRKLKKSHWIVTEKVHGSNFCILTDGQRIEYAKRKQILSENENFFGYFALKDELEKKISEIFRLLKHETKDIGEEIMQISVYGELFGGLYENPLVEKVPNVFPVQTGVQYCPDVKFMAFDILIRYSKNRNESSVKQRYLDYDEFENFCKKTNLFYSRALFKGTYEQCHEFDNRFSSTLPSAFRLPHISGENNAEGVVLKMEKSLNIDNHDSSRSIRLAVKRKIVEFDEVEYNQAEKWPEIVGDNRHAMFMPFITKNRMQNTLSKVGHANRVNPNDADAVLDDFADDVIDAYYTKSDGSAVVVNDNVARPFIVQCGMKILREILDI